MYANEVRGTLLVQACSLESKREDCGPMLQNNLPVTDLKHLMSFIWCKLFSKEKQSFTTII